MNDSDEMTEAEYMNEYMLDNDERLELQHEFLYGSKDLPKIPNKPPEYWVDKNGKKHKISNMNTNHIKNCIKMVKRKEQNRLHDFFIKALEEELQTR